MIKKEKADTTKKYLEKAELKIVFETQLPFDITVQGFVLDDNDEVIDMLFPAGGHKVLANDNVSADGSVNSVKEVTTFVSIDQQKFNNIASSKKIVYKVNGNTSNVKKVNEPVYVKLKSDYLFGIRAGLLAEFKYKAPKITFENEKE